MNICRKDHEGAAMGRRGNACSVSGETLGLSPRSRVLPENKTAETCVVVIVSFFTQFQKETSYATAAYPVICVLVTQLSTTAQSRRGPKISSALRFHGNQQLGRGKRYLHHFNHPFRGGSDPGSASVPALQPALPAPQPEPSKIQERCSGGSVCGVSSGDMGEE